MIQSALLTGFHLHPAAAESVNVPVIPSLGEKAEVGLTEVTQDESGLSWIKVYFSLPTVTVPVRGTAPVLGEAE